MDINVAKCSIFNGSFTLAESASETDTDSMKFYCQCERFLYRFIRGIYFSVSVLDSVSVIVKTP